MHWPNRQVVFPLFICSTLTGVCLTLYYYFKKKDDEEDSRKTRIETRRPACIELEIPKQYIPAIVGRAGSIIKDLQIRTSTRIAFEPDVNSESLNRLCYIKGKLENAQLAAELVKKIVETESNIKTKDIYVPHKSCRRIIGPNGETIREIQALTGTRINVEPYSYNYHQPTRPDSKRKIVIRGNVDQIESAQVLIEEKIGEEEIKKEHEVLDLIEPQQNKDRIKEHRNVTQIHQKQDVKEDSDVADIQHKEEDIEELNISLEVIEEIEEIDLSTPIKNFIKNEHVDTQKRITDLKIKPNAKCAPAGYESDLSDDSDEMEMF